jgi:hypothetical protein
MCSDDQVRIPRRCWRTTCKKWLAFLVLLLPGIVWFPADAATDKHAVSIGGPWLRSSAEAKPSAALSVDTRIRARHRQHGTHRGHPVLHLFTTSVASTPPHEAQQPPARDALSAC